MELKELDRLITDLKKVYKRNKEYYGKNFLISNKMTMDDTVTSDEAEALIKFVLEVDE